MRIINAYLFRAIAGSTALVLLVLLAQALLESFLRLQRLQTSYQILIT